MVHRFAANLVELNIFLSRSGFSFGRDTFRTVAIVPDSIMTQEFSEASYINVSAKNAVLCRMFQALVAEQQDTTARQQDILGATGVQSSAHERAAEGKPPRVAANQNFRCEVCNLGVGTLAVFKNGSR